MILINQLLAIHQKNQTLGTDLKSINLLIAAGAITKTGTLTTIFHMPEGEENNYVWFGIRPTYYLLSHQRTSFRINVR